MGLEYVEWEEQDTLVTADDVVCPLSACIAFIITDNSIIYKLIEDLYQRGGGELAIKWIYFDVS